MSELFYATAAVEANPTCALLGRGMLKCLVSAMTGLDQVPSWAIAAENYTGHELAQFLVWGGWWGGHWWVDAASRRENTHGCITSAGR